MVILPDIKLAQARIRGVATHTPLIRSHDQRPGQSLYFKPENLQPVGSFKLRGAYNKIASLSDAEKARGIIAFSSGNHAQGVAFAARALNVRATIVMPVIAPAVKVGKTRSLGAEVVLLKEGGEEEWRMAAEEIAEQSGFVMVPPFNDETIIAGQGTIGLEILEDLPDVDTVLAPIGGGGLLSGLATALKLSQHDVRVIGIEPELAADAQESFRTGKVIAWPLEKTRRTMADGMRATQIGDITFAHITEFVDDIITVSEDEIQQAMRNMLMNERLVTEPSGAVTYAAWLFHQAAMADSKQTVAVISGGNVEASVLAAALAG